MRRMHGLTIVELLIVIVVVGILAALSYVAYTNISNNARDSAVKQDLRSLSQLLNLYKAEQGVYPAQISASTLSSYGAVKVTKDSYDTTGIHGAGGVYAGQFNFIYCSQSGSLDQFGLAAKSRSGKIFQLSEGVIGDFTGTEPGTSEWLCASVVSSPSVANRTWLYSSGAWPSWIGS